MKKGPRLVILLALVGAGGLVAFAGATPQGYASVADVMADPAAMEGREVEVKGSVVEGSLARDADPVRFLVTDGGATMEVRWDPAHPLPDHEAGGTIEGKNVVVKAVVASDATGPYLLASSMQVGCASKYRAAE